MIALARRLAFAATVLVLIVVSACAPSRSAATVATSSVGGERFSIVVRDGVLLEQVRSWKRGEPGELGPPTDERRVARTGRRHGAGDRGDEDTPPLLVKAERFR
jgi:hypothetical protein